MTEDDGILLVSKEHPRHNIFRRFLFYIWCLFDGDIDKSALETIEIEIKKYQKGGGN